jgi:hypothetical protein
LDYTLDALETCRTEGQLPLNQMRRLTELGIMFDNSTRKWGERQFEYEIDYLKGGSGWGEGARIFGDMPLPSSKRDCRRMLSRTYNIKRVVVKGGKEKSIHDSEVPLKQLQAIIATEIRRERGEARRRERLLNQI